MFKEEMIVMSSFNSMSQVSLLINDCNNDNDDDEDTNDCDNNSKVIDIHAELRMITRSFSKSFN